MAWQGLHLQATRGTLRRRKRSSLSSDSLLLLAKGLLGGEVLKIGAHISTRLWPMIVSIPSQTHVVAQRRRGRSDPSVVAYASLVPQSQPFLLMLLPRGFRRDLFTPDSWSRRLMGWKASSVSRVPRRRTFAAPLLELGADRKLTNCWLAW